MGGRGRPSPPDAASPARSWLQRAYGIELVRRGYVVIAIDIFYFGERRMVLDDDPPEWKERRMSISEAQVHVLGDGLPAAAEPGADQRRGERRGVRNRYCALSGGLEGEAYFPARGGGPSRRTEGAPIGFPRCTLRRTAAGSASVCSAVTCSAQPGQRG